MRRALAFINPRLTTQNVGDIFIEDSVKRILVHDTANSVDIDPRRPLHQADFDRINHCHAAIIVGTNLWYRELRRPGRWTLTIDDLRKIRVPVIPFGVGTSRRFDEDDGFATETLEQLCWIHGSCTVGSARDPRTAQALTAAGIQNVAMTGCPTLFRSLEACWGLVQKPQASRVVVTTRNGHSQSARSLLRHLRALGLDPVIAAQKPHDRIRRSANPFSGPAAPTLFRHDIEPYLKLVKETLGAVGWRLHGNMLHLAHGNPAIFFANNSRAQSFCEAFGLPCISAADGEKIEPERIAEHASLLQDPLTFRKVPERYQAARGAMVRFLDANGLEHRLGP